MVRQICVFERMVEYVLLTLRDKVVAKADVEFVAGYLQYFGSGSRTTGFAAKQSYLSVSR